MITFIRWMVDLLDRLKEKYGNNECSFDLETARERLMDLLGEGVIEFRKEA